MCFAAVLAQLCLGLYAMPWVNLLYYFTNWTLFITIFSIWYSIKAVSLDPNFSKSSKNLAIHHILYTTAIIFNIVTVSVYWTLIHEGNMKTLRKEGIYCKILQQITVHITPGIACFINTLITNTVLTRKMALPLLTFGAFYLVVNFVQVKTSGKPVYDFLTWEDSTSLILVLGLKAGFALVYLFICVLDEQYK